MLENLLFFVPWVTSAVELRSAGRSFNLSRNAAEEIMGTVLQAWRTSRAAESGTFSWPRHAQSTPRRSCAARTRTASASPVSAGAAKGGATRERQYTGSTKVRPSFLAQDATSATTPMFLFICSKAESITT